MGNFLDNLLNEICWALYTPKINVNPEDAEKVILSLNEKESLGNYSGEIEIKTSEGEKIFYEIGSGAYCKAYGL